MVNDMRKFIRKIETDKKSYKKSYVSIYSNKIKWRIILPEEVYLKLKDCLMVNPPNFKYNKEIGLYYLSLISSIPSYKKDKEYPGGYVNLESRKLLAVNYNYKKYMDYFVDNEILERNDSYSNVSGKGFSKSYRYNYRKLKTLTWSIFELELLKSTYERFEIKEKSISSEPNYLLKWFNPNLTIDFENAILEIQQKLKYTLKNEKITKKKAENYLRSLKNLHFQEFWSSRNSETDNRLHTILVNLPKFLRKYILYDGRYLAGVDIRNSQPYFLVILIEMIRSISELDMKDKWKYEIEKYDLSGTMFMKLTKLFDSTEFQNEYCKIKNDILTGTFYENLEQHFEFKSIDGKYQRRFYCKETNTQPIYSFDEKRDLLKKLVLFFFYKSNQENEKKEDSDYLIFKSLYPKFCNMLELIKENSNKDLPKLLQHLESNCVIDYTCKKISEKYPDMPLFTIHDSIISTEENIAILKKEVIENIGEYCNGILPELKTEYWNGHEIDRKSA